MNALGSVIVNRCIKVIIMLIPSLLWLTLVMYGICFGVSHLIFNLITYLIMILLCFTMLFLNSMLKIEFADNSFENMQYQFKKPNKEELFYYFITGLPLVLILFLTPIWLFLIYGMIQFIYILIDKEHLSIMERIFILIVKTITKINHKKLNRKQEKINSALPS